ncbi:MAG TPA: zinc ribbon domain-containing protein [Gemmatimonadaceae bacterium]|jgi:putative FmdB family regulatory protein|nr:zinc ribbon domain-containing protein [Gemmatimonadaceae bacterium]
MPTYEYRCLNGHDFEKFYRTISASEAELVCPTCGAKAERRVSAGAGLVFKGSGFYLTDYGRNAHAKRGGATPAAAASEGASASSDAAPKPSSGAGAAATPAPAADTKSATKGND